MKKTKTNRILLFLAGILAIVAGIVLLRNPVEGLLAISYVFSIAIITSGIMQIIDGFSLHPVDPFRSIFIFEGFLWTLVGIMTLFVDSFINTSALSFLLLFTFILSAIIRLQYSFVIEKTWIKVVSIISNIILITMSSYALFNPLLANSILVTTIAIQFLIAGFDSIIISLHK